MSTRLLTVITLLSFVLLGGWYVAKADNHAPNNKNISTISVNEVERLLGVENVFIFDVNSQDTFEEGHVPGAVRVKFNQISEAVLPSNRDAKLIFYCMNSLCSASSYAANQAANLGYTNVYHMAEGIQGWTKAGKPIER